MVDLLNNYIMGFADHLFLLNIILLSLIFTSIALCLTQKLINSILYSAIASIFLVITYLFMDAPDVAMTEAAIGASLSTAIILMILHNTSDINSSTQDKNRLLVGSICVILCFALTYLFLEYLPNYGDLNSPVKQHVSGYYVENTERDIGINSIVAAILGSYRGFDTLGETLVILTALLSVSMIMFNFTRKQKEAVASTAKSGKSDGDLSNHIILRVVNNFIIPFILALAFYIQINGETSPGGGFQAGAILATAIIALDFIYTRKSFSEILGLVGLIKIAAIGLFIYVGTGCVSLFTGDNYLNYSSLPGESAQHIGIAIIELGVGITVSSVMLALYFTFKGRNND